MAGLVVVDVGCGISSGFGFDCFVCVGVWLSGFVVVGLWLGVWWFGWILVCVDLLLVILQDCEFWLQVVVWFGAVDWCCGFWVSLWVWLWVLWGGTCLWVVWV